MKYYHIIIYWIILLYQQQQLVSTTEIIGFYFIIEPNDIIIPIGESGIFHCVTTTTTTTGTSSSSSNESLKKIIWKKDGINIDTNNNNDSNQQNILLNNGSLYITPMKTTITKNNLQHIEGHYQCLVTMDGIGSILSKSGKLKMISSTLYKYIEEPEDIIIGYKQTARFGCSIDNNNNNNNNINNNNDLNHQSLLNLGTLPQLTNWYKNNEPLAMDYTRMTVLPSGSLEIQNINELDEGTYHCNLSNYPFISSSRKGRLVLNENPIKNISPIFTTIPKNQNVLISSSILFECSAVGYPLPIISWLKDGVTLDINNNNKIQQQQQQQQYKHNNNKYNKIGEGNLIINNIVEVDSGTYQCRAENSEDSIDVSATLNVYSIPHVLHDVKYTNIYGYEKLDIELACKIHGIPTPRIQWYKNGDKIIEGDYFQMNGNNLFILGLVESDGGMYQCIGINIVGNVQSTIYLKILKQGQIIPTTTNNNNNIKEGITTTTTTGRTTTTTTTNTTIIDTYAPSNLQILFISTRYIKLSWKPPIHSNGKIISYIIYYKEMNSLRERILNITTTPTSTTTTTSYSFDTPTTTTTTTTTTFVDEINNIIVQGLQPNKTYTFRIVPYNEYGMFGSSSTEINVLTKSEINVQPGPPKYLKAIPVSSTSIFISWDVPNDNSYIKNYKVYYNEIIHSSMNGNDENGLFENDTAAAIPHILVTNEFIILNNLKIFTEYYIWVVCINENDIPSINSEKIKIATLSDIPSSSPINITIEPSSTSILIHWEPPPLSTRNGVITGYKIKYKMKGVKKSNTLTTDGNTRYINIYHLNKNVEYSIKISALNINGSGPYTEWYNVYTYENDLDENIVPDKPNNLQARPMSESITITWTPPYNTNVVVRGYTIGWGKGIPDVYSKLVDGKSRYFIIENLKSNSDYVISLRAYNQVGDGIPIYENVRTRNKQDDDDDDDGDDDDDDAKENHGGGSSHHSIHNIIQFPPPVGLRAIVLSSTSIVLYWTDTLLKSYNVDKRLYIIRYTTADYKLYKYINTTEQNIIINDLKPGINYEFSVKVIRNKKSSEWSLVVYNRTTPIYLPTGQQSNTNTNTNNINIMFTTASTSSSSILITPPPTSEPIYKLLPPPKDLTLLAITNSHDISTVVLSWQPPKINANSGDVKGYLLFYTTNPKLSEWVEEIVPEDVLTHSLSGLTPDTTYYFRMSAKYNHAYSPNTIIKSVSTPLSKNNINYNNNEESITTNDNNNNNIKSMGENNNNGNNNNKQQPGGPIVIQPLLYILIGVSILIAIISVICCTYYKKKRPGDDDDDHHHHNGSPKRNNKKKYTSSSNSSSSKMEIKPPDLWIHHDQMSFKNIEKNLNHSSQNECLLLSQQQQQQHCGGGGSSSGGNLKEFDTNLIEKIPLQYKMNSLDRSGGGGGDFGGMSLSCGTSSSGGGGGGVGGGGKSCDTFPSSKSQQQYRMTEFTNNTTGPTINNTTNTPSQNTLNRRGSNLKSFNVGHDHHTNSGNMGSGNSGVGGENIIPQLYSGSGSGSGGNVGRSSSSSTSHNVPSPIHRLSSTLGRREPTLITYNTDSTQCCSNEDLSQEISNLEGLMKDLTAITASEFQC